MASVEADMHEEILTNSPLNSPLRNRNFCQPCQLLPFEEAAVDRAVMLLQMAQDRDEPYQCLKDALSGERIAKGVVCKEAIVGYLLSQFGVPMFAGEWLWQTYAYALHCVTYEHELGCTRQGQDEEKDNEHRLQNAIPSEPADAEDDLWLAYPSDELWCLGDSERQGDEAEEKDNEYKLRNAIPSEPADAEDDLWLAYPSDELQCLEESDDDISL